MTQLSSFLVKSRLQQRTFFCLALLVLVSQEAFAQRALSNGTVAITNVGTGLGNYIQPITNVCYIIAAIIGIIGGVQVYSKWASGDPQAGKTAASWGAAAVFLIMVPAILTTLFGIQMS